MSISYIARSRSSAGRLILTAALSRARHTALLTVIQVFKRNE